MVCNANDKDVREFQHEHLNEVKEWKHSKHINVNNELKKWTKIWWYVHI